MKELFGIWCAMIGLFIIAAIPTAVVVWIVKLTSGAYNGLGILLSLLFLSIFFSARAVIVKNILD